MILPNSQKSIDRARQSNQTYTNTRYSRTTSKILRPLRTNSVSIDQLTTKPTNISHWMRKRRSTIANDKEKSLFLAVITTDLPEIPLTETNPLLQDSTMQTKNKRKIKQTQTLGRGKVRTGIVRAARRMEGRALRTPVSS